MKVLLTGATGFVGRALNIRLSCAGHVVHQAVRRDTGLTRSVLIQGIDANTEWQAALDGCETVIHLAARVHVLSEALSDPLTEFRRVNVEGSVNLARQAQRAGVRRFVFMSTIGVNGHHTTNHAFTEKDVPRPHDAYSLSKHEAELRLRALARSGDMEVVIIRPPLVYGPGAKGNFATLVRLLQKGLPLPLGSVRNRRSFVALDNLVDFIVCCSCRDTSPAAANEVFLISDGVDVSTTQFLEMTSHALGVRPRLIPVPTPWLRTTARLIGREALTNKLLDSLVIDSAKAKNVLGWLPIVSMEEQLKKILPHATAP